MPVEFSEHAEGQIRKRKLSKKLIIETVRAPEQILSSFRVRKLRRKRIGSKILEVVTKTEGPKITIVTAYYLEDRNES